MVLEMQSKHFGYANYRKPLFALQNPVNVHYSGVVDEVFINVSQIELKIMHNGSEVIPKCCEINRIM